MQDDVIADLTANEEEVYKLRWEKLVGNDLIFDEHGELISKNSEHLVWCSNTKFIEKKIEDEKVKQDRKVGADNNTNFYKQMMKKLMEEPKQL